MPVKLTTKEFIEKAKKVHGDKYDYSLVNYEHSKIKVKIICKIHGIFKQSPNDHLDKNGCRKCATKLVTDNQRLSINDFVARSKKLHGNRYDYSEVIYKGFHIKVAIKCLIHGNFLQRPADHLRGHGCRKCGFERQKKKINFSSQFFENSYKNNKAILYILKCYNESEEFYKVGITGRSIKLRFGSKISMPYKYDIVFEYSDVNPDLIYKLESDIRRKYKQLRYRPQIRFNGITECFNLNFPFEEIINII